VSFELGLGNTLQYGIQLLLASLHAEHCTCRMGTSLRSGLGILSTTMVVMAILVMCGGVWGPDKVYFSFTRAHRRALQVIIQNWKASLMAVRSTKKRERGLSS
jgi:hypothetical protein